MSQQPGLSRLEQLEAWKARKAAEKGAGALAASAGNRQGQLGGPGAKPTLGLPPRQARAASQDKENAAGIRAAAGGGGGALHRHVGEGSARKALPDSQKQQMESTFDSLQERMMALKRESVRPTISATGGAAAAARTTAPQPAPMAAHQPAAAPPAPAAAASTAAAPPGSYSVAGSRPPRAEAADPAPAHHPGMGGFGGIAARLECLKRESMRPSIAGGASAAVASQQGSVQFEMGGQFDGQALTKLAFALFEEEGFKQLCDKGMNAQLTRSKDGATEETKIKELAGMVKLLRRGMKDLQTKANEFIAAACKYEREVAQQVESVKLSAESERMHMQAEVARLRSEMAGLAADHKAERSQWAEKLAAQQGHEQRYMLEVDRLEGEKATLGEKLRRVEASKLDVEEQLKRALKEMNTDLNRLKADTNKEAEERYAAAQAAERKHAALADALTAAEARGEELAEANAGLQRQVEGLQKAAGRLERQLEDLRTTHEGLAAEHEKLHADFSSHRDAHEKLVADSASALRELEETQEELSRTVASLKSECSAHLATKQRLDALAASTGEEAAAAAGARATLEADKAAAEERARSVAAEKEAAEARAAQLGAKVAEYEGMMAEAANEIEQLRGQCSAAEGLAKDAQAALEAARSQAASLEAQLEEAAQGAAAARREAAEKGEKLAQLEAELEALQECTIGLGAGDQREMLTRLVSKVASLEAAVAAAEAKRREIHNQLVELKGNIRVFCRIRPNARSSVHCLPDGTSVRLSGLDGKDHLFSFDRVFGPEAGQPAVFAEVADLVQSALDGFKVCLFSYGQTGAGKTHTMQGSKGYEGQGIIPRSVTQILSAVGKLREQGWEYKLEASFVEVYNETLRDLLAEPSGPGRRAEAGKITEPNAIQHQPNGGHTLVLGASRLPVETEGDADALVRRAAAARAVEATAMNAVSSRSHSVFMLYITGRHEASGTLLQGSLNLVDLAGSERLARSQAEGARAKEACNINKSLSSLGDVFQALAAKQPHVPYRNSKLTHLLQPCLGGSGKTLMFVNVNPEPESAQESLCSLRFAAKVNACETAAKGGAQRNVSIMEMTGRPSLAPGDPEARRMSMAPGGIKRKAGLPVAQSGIPPRGIPRPKLY